MKRKTRSKPRQPITTALARRVPDVGKIIRARPVRRRPIADLISTVLTEDANLGALGLVEVKLTPAEEAICNEPVDVSKVLIKPTGQPYLPHAEYTRWMNRAFGRLGWSMVPRSKPLANGVGTGRVLVTIPYILYIHGKPAAFAIGEQEYYESNKEQTYGDAAEATVASALRRCMKRLGVGLELWDKAFLNAFVDEHCVRVEVDQRGERSDKWRRLTDPPFWNEIGPGGQRPAADTRGSAPAQRRDASSWQHRNDAPISEPQHRRLWVYINNSGRDDDQVKQWIRLEYGVELSHKYDKEPKHITRADYDGIIAAIEDSNKPLPTKGKR